MSVYGGFARFEMFRLRFEQAAEEVIVAVQVAVRAFQRDAGRLEVGAERPGLRDETLDPLVDGRRNMVGGNVLSVGQADECESLLNVDGNLVEQFGDT